MAGSFFSFKQDTLINPRFTDLRRTTEAVFEAKKDSFAYHKDFVTQENGRPVKIYSMVWVGHLFNEFDRHALIGYSLNDTTLQIEIKHLIGKVWVQRFRNISVVNHAWDKLSEPAMLIKGDHEETQLFIAGKNGPSAYMGVTGDKWVYVKGSFKKLNR